MKGIKRGPYRRGNEDWDEEDAEMTPIEALAAVCSEFYLEEVRNESISVPVPVHFQQQYEEIDRHRSAATPSPIPRFSGVLTPPLSPVDPVKVDSYVVLRSSGSPGAPLVATVVRSSQ
jgi:hypothetical protein